MRCIFPNSPFKNENELKNLLIWWCFNLIKAFVNGYTHTYVKEAFNGSLPY